jgi:hypothetical protein
MALGNEQSREDRIRERAYEIWEREGRKMVITSAIGTRRKRK